MMSLLRRRMMMAIRNAEEDESKKELICFTDIDGAESTAGTGYWVSTLSQQYNVIRFSQSETHETYLIPCNAGQDVVIWNINNSGNTIANVSTGAGEEIIVNARTGTQISIRTGEIYDGKYTTDLIITVKQSVLNEELSNILGNNPLSTYYTKASVTAFIDGYILVNNLCAVPLYVER